MPNFKVKDLSLASEGKRQIEWAEAHMPVLLQIRKEFKRRLPLRQTVVAACLHVTKETAVLVKTLKAGGAQVALCASNPLSTQDEVAAALVKEGIAVFAWRGQSAADYYQSLHRVLEFKPQITLDDGADLISTLHKEKKELLSAVYGGQEETTTGVIRLRAMAAEGALKYPVVAVNDTPTKRMFDNVYGTGQSTIDGILRATNLMLAGKTVVVYGSGYCSSGIAQRARGMGAKVIVTEVDPLKALKAVMDGFWVMPLKKAAPQGDIFITATGNKDVIHREHLELMKDGAVLANAGHFNVEINLNHLKSLATKKRKIKNNVEEYRLKDGRRLYLLAEGRLVNLGAAEGHPSSVMDMSFANQALVCRWLVKNHQRLKNQVYDVPSAIDRRVARLKLASLGVKIDTLTPDQRRYLASWQEGT